MTDASKQNNTGPLGGPVTKLYQLDTQVKKRQKTHPSQPSLQHQSIFLSASQQYELGLYSIFTQNIKDLQLHAPR